MASTAQGKQPAPPEAKACPLFSTFKEVLFATICCIFVLRWYLLLLSPLHQVGSFDPYSDDPRLGIQKIFLCKYSGYLAVAGTAGQVLIGLIYQMDLDGLLQLRDLGFHTAIQLSLIRPSCQIVSFILTISGLWELDAIHSCSETASFFCWFWLKSGFLDNGLFTAQWGNNFHTPASQIFSAVLLRAMHKFCYLLNMWCPLIQLQLQVILT